MLNASYIILAAALLPAVVLIIIIVIRDKEQPEPPMMLAKGILYGVLSAFGSLAISMPLMAAGLVPQAYTNSVEAVFYSFGVAALPEELAKLFFLWLLMRNNKYFDEHLDGIVYAVCIGLGFAAFENIQYVFNAGDQWALTAILRGLLSVPAHFFFAVLMGYYYSLVHFGHNPRRNAVWVLAAPVLAHGIFDTIAMAQEVSPGLEAMFGLVLLLFCNELRKLCSRHIREMAAADKDSYQRSEH